MRVLAIFISVFLVSQSTRSEDCFDLAGRDYKIDPDLLRAISWQESHFEPRARGRNPGQGYGIGLMQIDSQHLSELKQYGITSELLLNDPCMNIYTGAYYLAKAFDSWGVSWESVGAYNAGFKRSPRQAARRYNYAKKIKKNYVAIKKSHGEALIIERH